MIRCEDFHEVASETIDDSVVADEYLADRRVIELGNDPSGFREGGVAVDRL